MSKDKTQEETNNHWEAGFAASKLDVLEHLTQASTDGRARVCPLCGHASWSLMMDPEDRSPARFSTTGQSGSPSREISGERQFFHLSCTACGNTHWIDVSAVGNFLLNRDRKEEG